MILSDVICGLVYFISMIVVHISDVIDEMMLSLIALSLTLNNAIALVKKAGRYISLVKKAETNAINL